MDVIRKIRGSEDEPRSESLDPLPELDVDIEEWLNVKELDSGGAYRRDKKGYSWWLPEKELAFYEMTNNGPDFEDDDDGFWAWFDTFRVERRLKPTRVTSWSYGSGVKKTYDSGSYFSSMWKGFGFGGSYGSTKTTELATTLGFVQTLIQAVRTKPGRYKVEFASEDVRETPTSYTDFENQHIVISPQAALDKKIDVDRRIRITTGYALHEASHTEFTVDRWPVLKQPSLLKPPQIASMLLNIIEDVRIELRMGENFPGFADYFEDMRQYLWEIGSTSPTRERLGEMPENLNEMLSLVIQTIRWPDKLEPELKNDEVKAEFAWWKDWHERYAPLTTNPKIREHLEKALNRLATLFPEEMAKATEEYDKASEGFGESAIREVIKGLLKRLEDKIGESFCARGEETIKREEARDVTRKLDEEWEIEKKEEHEPGMDGIENYELLVRRPSMDGADPYEPDRGPMARRLKSAFVLRPAKPEYADRLLRQGQVDDEELWRWGAGDYRFFEQKIRETAPDTDITLLVDESGSMASGGAMVQAKRLAQLMLDCLSRMDGVNLKVRGHTGQTGDFNGVIINRIWEPGDDVNRIGLLEANSQNMDGYAIEWCVRELQHGRGDTQKILIVLADGQPSAGGYGGRAAISHVREVVNRAEREGVYVVQLGVGGYLPEDTQRAMFNHYIPFTDDDQLLRDLTKLMSKLF